MTSSEKQEYIRLHLTRFTKDKHLLDELTQTVNIKLHTTKSTDHNKPLLYSMVRCVYIDYYRKINSQKARATVYEEHDVPCNLRPDEALINKENKNILLECIELLPEKQRDVVYLRYYCDLDFLKISEIMKCPKNTALTYMHRAKENLKILLTKTNNYEN